MSLVEKLYPEDESYLHAIWSKFGFLSPSLGFLKKEATRCALREDDKTYPLHAFRFTLFPEEPDEQAQERFRQCMNRGIHAVNTLCAEYLNKNMYENLQIKEVPAPFDFFEFVKTAYDYWERGFTKRRRVDPQLRAEAYGSMRAIELGYRVARIDASPEVLNSLRYFKQVTQRLKQLLNFQNPRDIDGVFTGWDTAAEVSVYSQDPAIPMPSRLKYLLGKDSAKPKYSSILMKMYRDLEFPNEILDYIGVELTAQDNEARDKLVSFLRRSTSPVGLFERFKDTTAGEKLSEASSLHFGVKKFVLRIPAKVEDGRIERGDRTLYEMVPVEMQVLTQEDVRNRANLPEVSHYEYKRRQFLQVFPAWFPRQIYEPLLTGQS